ncbi:hypothetical protein A0O28_0048510 [Trichoderma guizhouense]|uniref:Uncharacterized protein n=1 Tax=Trichoderma guizhouense TaxID=1491466 RepID=A0A1T3CDV4_9HYPO|nr:hypothetical protein A0O28_0048510 [Trichoderma guizhouense]
MADSRSQEEVLEDLKNTVLHTPVCLDAEIQRLNISFLEKELLVKVANGEYIYYDERGKMSMTGVSPGEWSITRFQSEPQFDTCILWGPGAEAAVAKRLIDRAPAVKHSIWTTTQEVLSKIPADPIMAPAVIGLLRSAIAKERECWERLDDLKAVKTYTSLLHLNMEAIITSMCSLAGITVVGAGEGTLMPTESGLSDLYRNLQWLRYNHQVEWEENPYYNPHRGDFDGPGVLDRFKAKWNPILERLLPGRLDNQMEQYADKMQYILDNDERYSPR